METNISVYDTNVLPSSILHFHPFLLANLDSDYARKDTLLRFYKSQRTQVEPHCNLWYGSFRCKKIVMKVCKDQKLLVPEVRFDLIPIVGAGRASLRKDNSFYLSFPVQGATGCTILHELAHYIDFLSIGKNWGRQTTEQAHSYRFVRHFNILLKRYPYLIGSHYVWEELIP